MVLRIFLKTLYRHQISMKKINSLPDRTKWGSKARYALLFHFFFSNGDLYIFYLGLLLMVKHVTAHNYVPTNRKSSIKNKLLNSTISFFRCRLQLISSVIHSVSNFWISVFILPKRCIQRINNLCAVFLWSGPILSTKQNKYIL